jgi:hypothetical protein
VNDQIPDRPVLEWSFSRHFLGTVFKWSPSCFSHSNTGPKIKFSTKLDHFIIKNILFLTVLLIKRSKLVTIQKLDKFFRFSNCPVFGCLGPAKIDHSKTGFAWYSVVHCIFNGLWIPLYQYLFVFYHTVFAILNLLFVFRMQHQHQIDDQDRRPSDN